ncbi:copper homeostasis membrane protein CopD [Enterobacter sp. Bisph1]|uniref:copper homeostasis membrane protein CopD n=1 Tax=Enterobacter sp. Bisph1 TaxID=1274399 RepID=UPI00057BD9B9|nr:copper homeostasis membrane protein CopD [Enterobacter sp. Bisph1]
MLVAAFVGLRFIHFATLMVIFGCALFSAWLAPPSLQPLLRQYFHRLQRCCLWLAALSAALMFAVQSGMMGEGWQDAVRPAIWQAALTTQTGVVLAGQIALAGLALGVALLQPRQQGKVLLLVVLQFVLAAGIGHAAMREGVPGVLQRGNQTVHLLCAALWLGGLLPVLFCMHLARGPSRAAAIAAMMRFSWFGHFAVAGVILTGLFNTLFIHGFAVPWDSRWGQWLVMKCAFVALMVVIALTNRYVLVPRLSLKNDAAQQRFIALTWAEIGFGALVLAAVSLFATWEPF